MSHYPWSVTQLAASGNLSLLRLYAAAGVDLDHEHIDGAVDVTPTPLHFACANGHLDVVRFLVNDIGANTECRTHNGWTPLLSAAAGGYTPVIAFLHSAVRVEMNASANNGFTAIHCAVASGHMRSVVYLIEKTNCRLSSVSVDGWTALHISVATAQPNVALVGYLLQHFDVNVRTESDGQTPLHLAALLNADDDVIRLLLHRGANVSVKDKYDIEPLAYACRRGHPRCMNIIRIARQQLEPLTTDYCRHLMALAKFDSARDVIRRWDDDLNGRIVTTSLVEADAEEDMTLDLEDAVGDTRFPTSFRRPYNRVAVSDDRDGGDDSATARSAPPRSIVDANTAAFTTILDDGDGVPVIAYSSLIAQRAFALSDATHVTVYRGVHVVMRILQREIQNADEADDARWTEYVSQVIRPMSAFNHPHIAVVMGIVERPHRCIVREYMPTSLQSFLAPAINPVIGKSQESADYSLITTLVGVARALSFLHQQTPPIPHRNVNANNVLVETVRDVYGHPTIRNAKLADTALPRHPIFTAPSPTSSPRPPLWSYRAPECLQDNQRADVKSDVFAFGLLTVHCANRNAPFTFLSQRGYREAVDNDQLGAFLALTTASAYTDLLTSIVRRCCAVNPLDRTTMAIVTTELEELNDTSIRIHNAAQREHSCNIS